MTPASMQNAFKFKSKRINIKGKENPKPIEIIATQSKDPFNFVSTLI